MRSPIPQTLRGALVSALLGLALGVAGVSLAFSLGWAGIVFENARTADTFSYLAIFGPLIGFNMMSYAKLTSRPLFALLLRGIGFILVLALPISLVLEVWQAEISLAPWVSRDFLALVVVSGASGLTILGLLALRGVDQWRGRILPLPVAALTIWIAAAEAIKLGPDLNFSDDPRYMLGTYAWIGSVAFGIAAVLVFFDWHINWRDSAERAEMARRDQETNHG